LSELLVAGFRRGQELSHRAKGAPANSLLTAR
jgi:hypothetical protein